MVTDPIADMLTRIKNGYLSRKAAVVLPWSKMKEALAKLLVQQGYLEGQKVINSRPVKTLSLELKYADKKPAVTDIKRVSRPSLRIYVNKNNLPRILGGLGISVISTPVGLLTDQEARKKHLGGEVVCKVW